MQPILDKCAFTSAHGEHYQNITNVFCTAFEKNKCTDMEQFRHVHLKFIFQVLRQFNLKIDG